MQWVTRKNANADRIACPWLIKRFVDKDATFSFVAADEVAEVAEREGAIPFDVKGVELGHVDGRCSFESIMVKYQLSDPGLIAVIDTEHMRLTQTVVTALGAHTFAFDPARQRLYSLWPDPHQVAVFSIAAAS